MSEETIATKLRQAREQQGKTYEQIHRQTGLSLNVLQAVEAGNFKVVEPIYVRMILKAYADHLGLDGAAILNQYNDQFGAPPPPLEVPPPPTPGPHPQVALGDDLDLPPAPGISPSWQPSPLPGSAFAEPKSRSRGGLLLLGGGALLLILLLALYWSDTNDEGPRISALPERPAPQARPPAGPRPELAPQRPAQAPPEVNAPPAALSEPAKPAPDIAVPPPLPAALAEPAAKPPAETLAPRPTPVPPPAAPAGALVLELEVIEPTWVRIRWDKGGFLETMLQPGDNRRLQANTQFLVWAGNSKGLRYRFQGQPVQEVSQSDPSHTVRFKATKTGVSLLDREAFDQLFQTVRGQDTTARARRDSLR
jgi:cytoskeleton protein RodZ